jgi:hypothetical protein
VNIKDQRLVVCDVDSTALLSKLHPLRTVRKSGFLKLEEGSLL